jgi:hypothetical protein
VLDPRKGRLKLFWHGLTDEEREKLSDVNVGQVMAKVVASEEKVCFNTFNLLSLLFFYLS